MTRKRSSDDDIINIENITQMAKISDLTKDYLKKRRELENVSDD